MNKLKMHSINKIDDNVGKIAQLFPNCVTEALVDNKLTKVVDFDMLKQELSSFVVEGREERYQFTWPDKKKSILLANSPIAKTLRPCKEESVDFDNTENLYIEGDNLDVLKLLQETYLGKIKMIYIDPPYNTGNDSFIYDDDSSISTDEFADRSGQYDEEGNILFDMKTNNEANGRFHTDWLNMIYPRLKVAKDLLSDEGVMFISIDDNEADNLKKLCNEIFGEKNFVSNIIWEKKFAPQNDAKWFSENHDHIICYAKAKENLEVKLLPRTNKLNSKYKNYDDDSRGAWTSGDLLRKDVQKSGLYTITTPNGNEYNPPSGRSWRVSEQKLLEMVADDRIWFGKEGGNVPRIKRFLSEVQDGIKSQTIWKFNDVGHNQEASQELRKLFDGESYFDTPKPVRLIERICYLTTKNNDIVLDFFSGSATTAHATMQLNAEDGENRKHIMVQLPELTDEKSEAYKSEYKNICEIGKERIRRSGKKIKEEIQNTQLKLGEEPKKVPDIGFRVLKLDSTNMKDVYYNPADYKPTLFDEVTDNIKDDRTPMDLLFQVILEMDVLLSSKIEEIEISGKKVFSVMDDYLIVCFDTGITTEVVEAIAKKKPYYAVFRDSCMADDSTMASFEQIFETYSKDTIREVL